MLRLPRIEHFDLWLKQSEKKVSDSLYFFDSRSFDTALLSYALNIQQMQLILFLHLHSFTPDTVHCNLRLYK